MAEAHDPEAFDKFDSHAVASSVEFAMGRFQCNFAGCFLLYVRCDCPDMWSFPRSIFPHTLWINNIVG
jgi:hypothetical protein